MKKYHYLVVGAGLFGAVFAEQARKKGRRVLVIDKREHIGGNVYTETVKGIEVHRYGAHIFHTSNRAVWDYVNRFASFNRYTNAPVANYKGELYNLPFNMNTFYALWGVRTPEQAKERIESEKRAAGIGTPKNLEEQAVSLVGTTLYEKLVKGYTEKQWGREADALPPFIINRLPVRFVFDNNYFNDLYQGIPIGGYTAMVERMLAGVDVWLSCDYFEHKKELDALADAVVFTGPIDAYYGYRYGALAYRSLRFENELLPISNYQGNAVVNYTEREVPYTRIIEHKHFEYGASLGRTAEGEAASYTVITREYPDAWECGREPYYTVNDVENNALYQKYAALAKEEKRVLFGGRLGRYSYLDMDKVIASSLALVSKII